MDYLDRFFKRKKAPDRDVEPPPEHEAARFFFLLTTHMTKLFVANVLFLLFCLPVVTIPAALSGLSRVCMLLVRDGVSFVWTDFITEFKASFKMSIAVFLASVVFLPSAYLCIYIGKSTEGASSFLLFVLAALIFFWSLLMTCYAYAMMSICNLGAGAIIRNAASLIFLEPKTDVFLTLLVGGIVIAFLWLLPYSLPVALILFSLLSLLAGVIIYEPIKRRIIAGS